jgi:hypothetical protein
MPPKRLPTSGSEHRFTHRLWGSKVGIGNNNCMAYAFHDFEYYRDQKSTPGDRTGNSNNGHSYTHCRGIPQKVLGDNPGKVYMVNPDKRCKQGYYKVMLFVAPSPPGAYIRQGDFHWYKQHNTVEYKMKEGDTVTSMARFFGVSRSVIQNALAKRRLKAPKKGRVIIFKANVWSHKRGWATEPLLVDAKGKAIFDPRRASRNYEGLNYKKFCSAFCVKNKGIKVGKSHPQILKKRV